VHHHLVAGLPPRHAGADLPHDPGGVGAADVVVLLGVVAEYRHGLAQRGPHVVVVDARRHHAHDHLEGAGLRDLDLLHLERVAGLTLALLADDPGGHRLGKLPGLHIYLGDLSQVDRHVLETSLSGKEVPAILDVNALARSHRRRRPLAGRHVDHTGARLPLR